MAKNEENYSSFKIAVPADYEEVFSHFYFAENTGVETITKTLLPSYQTILIFNFGTPAVLYSSQKTELKIDKCLVLGPVKQAFTYSLPENSGILVANFKDDAFYNFFGNAAVAEHLPLNPDDLLGENCFTSLWTQLNRISDNNDRVEYILEFSKPYLRQRNIIAEQLANFKGANLNPIKSIADAQNQTERNIQLNHKKHLGYTAKEINRYQRFLKAVELIQSVASTSDKMDWFNIINECGFYDQSQLIHDFKHYINLSPTKYLKFQQDICNPKAT
ncbi:AraC-like DNA-binding protein [Chryseobacterium ginsenosidimutans]|uniref:helix-turn-helix domain-containing protein n=1 Tax=Chryseobacterium ginsenosidimutans TaxID=687846 RepID=UPI0021671152|nr:helix-turn-helix domain-containing protein [Chryseobacterium ginsenosidimutans]MCS3869414.1 AraC-like DNA-binding protein [Chryseobacterium ginsenosidimutans]